MKVLFFFKLDVDLVLEISHDDFFDKRSDVNSNRNYKGTTGIKKPQIYVNLEKAKTQFIFISKLYHQGNIIF